MRDIAATWLNAFVWAETGAAILLAAAFWLLLGTAAYWLYRLVRWLFNSDDYRTLTDERAAQYSALLTPPGEQQTPGTDHQLLLDCIAVYGDCDELQRLRNAINDTREEEAS